MPPHPRDGRTLLGHLGEGTQTPPRPYLALPTPYSTAVRVSYGGVHTIFSILGSPWGIGGNAPHTPGMAGHCLVTLGGANTHHHDHIPRCRHRIRLRFGCRTVVCTSSSASRVAVGHWGQCPHTPGMAGHCLATFGGHTHTTTTTFGVTDSVFDGSKCSSGVVRWSAHHLQHLGSPWGIGGNDPTPQGWQDTAWSPSGDTHTPPQPLSALPTPEYGVGSAESGCGGVCVPPEGDQAVSCHPWGLGHCPQCPMAALDAEDGVHTTE